MAINSVDRQKTIQNIIDSTAKKTETRKTGELGKDDFLNLMITQLKYQDPMKPMEDKEFIGQMAQFTALEQMQNMNAGFSSTKAFAMIGKRITATITDVATSQAKPIEGEVSSVKIDGGKAYVVVNDTDVPVDKVTNVTDGFRNFNSSDISQFTGLIGFEAKGSVYDAANAKIVGVSGIVQEIQKGKTENYAVMDGVKVNVASIGTSIQSTDPNFRKNYLDGKVGKEVSLVISDINGNEVPVTATLRDYSIAGGRITATLDRLDVPVDSINNIKKETIATTTTKEEAAAK